MEVLVSISQSALGEGTIYRSAASFQMRSGSILLMRSTEAIKMSLNIMKDQPSRAIATHSAYCSAIHPTAGQKYSINFLNSTLLLMTGGLPLYLDVGISFKGPHVGASREYLIVKVQSMIVILNKSVPKDSSTLQFLLCFDEVQELCLECD